MQMTNRGAAVIMVVGALGLGACGDDGGPSAHPDGGGGNGGGSGAGGGEAPFVQGDECRRSGPTRDALADMLEPITNAVGVNDMHMTAQGLYWPSSRGVRRVADDGPSAVEVGNISVYEPLGSNSTLLAFFMHDGDDVGLYTVPLGSTGATPALASTAYDSATNLVLDDTYAFFDGGEVNGVQRAMLPSGEAEPFTEEFNVGQLLVDGGFLYFMEVLDEVIQRIPVAGGPAEVVTDPVGVIQGFLVDATNIYVYDHIALRRAERSTKASVPLLRPKAAEPPIDNDFGRVLDAGDRLVWADRLDNIGWVMKDGSDCGLIGTTDLTLAPPVFNTDIALDADYLYVVDEDSLLFRVARSEVGLD